jgi:hypothetical protein
MGIVCLFGALEIVLGACVAVDSVAFHIPRAFKVCRY